MGDGMLTTFRVAHEFGVPFGTTIFLADPKESTGRAGMDHELSPDEYVELLRYRKKLLGTELEPIDPGLLPPPGGPHHECSVCGLNCGGGLSGFDVEWDGTMLICNEVRSVSGKPLEEGFSACWERLHHFAATWPRIPACIDCPYEQVCTNCEIKKASIAGEPGKQPLALCERIQYLVRHGVYSIPACR